MPSPRPTAPMPSPRLGFTDTNAPSQRRRVSVRRPWRRGGARAAAARRRSTTSTFTTRQPAVRRALHHVAEQLDRRRRRGSGRRTPGTGCRGRAARPAPSSASATAWHTASASECPTSPSRDRRCVTPPSTSGRGVAPGRRTGGRRTRARPARVTTLSSSAAAIIEVGGPGHLEVPRVTGHDDDGAADRLHQRGVVGGVAAGARARRAAWRHRNAWGVCTATSPTRSTVAVTRTSSTRFSVSATARPGTAPSAPPRTAAIDRAEQVGGRRAGGPRRARRRSRPSSAPRRDRRAPTRRGSRRRSVDASTSAPSPLASRRARRARPRRTPRTRWRPRGRPGARRRDRQNCLGPPKRSPHPAATITAHT